MKGGLIVARTRMWNRSQHRRCERFFFAETISDILGYCLRTAPDFSAAQNRLLNAGSSNAAPAAGIGWSGRVSIAYACASPTRRLFMGMLKNKVAIITGASSGIGRAPALPFSAEVPPWC
jgi:hypothetical protein